jgi:hypothetical protein
LGGTLVWHYGVEGVRALIVSGGHLLWAAPKQLPIIWPWGTTDARDGIDSIPALDRHLPVGL